MSQQDIRQKKGAQNEAHDRNQSGSGADPRIDLVDQYQICQQQPRPGRDCRVIAGGGSRIARRLGQTVQQ